MPKIIIPTPLRKFTDNLASFEASATTVGAAIQELTSTYPELKKHVLEEDGALRKFLKVYLGDEDIEGLQNEQTPVAPEATISIIPAIAGGNH
ncbi:MAG: MoaD/ThiS family protein [Microscillaceae bacterium]|nr:MoaD/ThiS family protein [Microscillaceae bacterium]